MNVLITGCAGFIGSHLTEQLLKRGNHITGTDNYDPFYPRDLKEKNLSQVVNHPDFKFIQGDIFNKNTLNGCFSYQNPEIVVHLAAKAGVRPSLQDPESYFNVNVNGTLSILECMREHGVSKLVFASSSSIYGNNVKVPFSEIDPVDYPISPYAASKKVPNYFATHTTIYMDLTYIAFDFLQYMAQGNDPIWLFINSPRQFLTANQ